MIITPGCKYENEKIWRQILSLKFDCIWPSNFREEDENVKVYRQLTDGRLTVLTKAHKAFDQMSKKLRPTIHKTDILILKNPVLLFS